MIYCANRYHKIITDLIVILMLFAGFAFSQHKIKKMLGWEQKVAFKDAMRKYYDYQIAVGGKK